MLRLACVIAIVGCGGPPSSTPIENRPEPGVAAKVAEADRASAASEQLDYRAPVDVGPRATARRGAFRLYVDACRLGDVRSCWRAVAVWDRFGDEESMAMVTEVALATGKHCVAGDLPSCNALVAGRMYLLQYKRDLSAPDEKPARALCTAGLGAACYAVFDLHGYDDHPEMSLIERGCELGDSMSCDELMSKNRSADDVQRLRERHEAAIKAECKRGIILGCRFLDEPGSEKPSIAACRNGLPDACVWAGARHLPTDQQIALFSVGCPATGITCTDLAKLRIAAHEPEAARDALEHGCQARHLGACVETITAYRSHVFAEPVPGRADQLVAYVCGIEKPDEQEHITMPESETLAHLCGRD